MKTRNLLLLTATVTPRGGQPSLALQDPAARLAEYEAALRFYADLLERGAIDGILFAENSGYDLASLARRFPSPRIDWLAVSQADYPLHYHRGYGEFLLVDEAVQRSRLVAEAGEAARLWKVSGRYVVRNLAQVVRWAPRELDFYGAIADQWAEMSVLAWSMAGQRRIVQGLYRHFATGEPPELILFRLLQQPDLRDLAVVRSFTWPPFIVGRRGSDGSAFQGRLTRYRFALSMLGKLALLPWRSLRPAARPGPG